MADAPIVYRFIATGQGSVESAFKSIDAAARASSRSVEAAARATERARGGGASGRGRTGSASDAAYKEAERYAGKIEREAKRAADAQIREADRAAKHVAGIRDRHFRDEQRAQERHERARERTSTARMRSLTRAGEAVAYAGLGLGLSAVGLGGQAARESMRLQDIATRISISGRLAGKAGVDPATLRKEFEDAAIATPGAKATDVASGVKAYITKTGDIDMARKLAKTFAVSSVATDTSAEAIGKMSADLATKFQINTVEGMQAAIASVTFGGKEGAFEITDAAEKYAKMGAAGAAFGLDKGIAGVRTLQGLSQIGMGQTADRDVTATSMGAMFRQLTTEKGNIKKRLGIDVFTDKSETQARPITDLLPEIISKAKGSIPKVQDIFKDEGMAIPRALLTAYNDAGRGLGAGATAADRDTAGTAAVRAMLDKAINATGTWADVQKDQATISATSSSKLTAAWESITAAAGDKLAPQLAIFASKLAGSDKAFNVFFAGMNAAGDALEALGALLERLGLIDPDRKGKMGAEQDKAKAAADELGKMTAAEKATPEGARKEAELISARSFAQERESVLAQAQAKEDLQAAFVKDYVGAADPADIADKEGRAQVEMKARALASSLMRDPTDTLASSDFLQKVGGENEGQQAIRKQYEGNASKGGDDLVKAAADLTAAARALQAGQSNGGSILGATTQ